MVLFYFGALMFFIGMFGAFSQLPLASDWKEFAYVMILAIGWCTMIATGGPFV